MSFTRSARTIQELVYIESIQYYDILSGVKSISILCRSFTRRMTSIRRSLLSIWLQHKGAATSSRKSFMKRSSKGKPPETDEETWDRIETRQLLGSKASMPAGNIRSLCELINKFEKDTSMNVLKFQSL